MRQLRRQCALGVKGIFTAHAKNIEDIEKHNDLNELLEFLEKIIILSPSGARGQISNVYNI